MSTFAPSSKLALLLSLMLGGAGVAMAQQATSADSAHATERKRPAPVSGRVEMDPAAVALRPVTAVKPAATGAVSQARQVPPPASHDDLLPPDTTDVASAETKSVKPVSAGSPAANKRTELLPQGQDDAHHRHVQPKPSKQAAPAKAISKGKKKTRAPDERPSDARHAGHGKALSDKVVSSRMAKHASHKKDQPVRAHGGTSAGASKQADKVAGKPVPRAGHTASIAKKTKVQVQPGKAPKASKAAKAGTRPHAKRASGAA
jgi:hypothetical protein